MEQNVQILCKKCTSKVAVSQMHYDKSGENLICTPCYNKLYIKTTPEQSEIYQSSNSNRIKYHCLSCGYKFSRTEEFSFGGKCFNCGKQTVQREDTKQVLLKDSKHLLDY